MPYVNIPLYCDECIHCKCEGEVMVGSDDCGGGPEESFSCKKDRNMSYYWFYDNTCCPDFDDGY